MIVVFILSCALTLLVLDLALKHRPRGLSAAGVLVLVYALMIASVTGIWIWGLR